MAGNFDVCELLLQNGANPDFKTKEYKKSVLEYIDEFVEDKKITSNQADELKQLLLDYGYQCKEQIIFKINQISSVKENLRLRDYESTSSPIVTTLRKESLVKIKMLGKYATIDGIKNRWVYIETQEGAKNRDGKELKIGTCGWCFGGYLE